MSSGSGAWGRPGPFPVVRFSCSPGTAAVPGVVDGHAVREAEIISRIVSHQGAASQPRREGPLIIRVEAGVHRIPQARRTCGLGDTSRWCALSRGRRPFGSGSSGGPEPSSGRWQFRRRRSRRCLRPGNTEFLEFSAWRDRLRRRSLYQAEPRPTAASPKLRSSTARSLAGRHEMLDHLAHMAVASLSADSSSTATRRSSRAATVAPPDLVAAAAFRATEHRPRSGSRPGHHVRGPRRIMGCVSSKQQRAHEGSRALPDVVGYTVGCLQQVSR